MHADHLGIRSILRSNRAVFSAFWLVLFLSPTVPGCGVAQAGPAPSDPPGWGGFSLGIFLAHDQAREDLLVPMRWKGPGVGLRLRWGNPGAARNHSLDLLLPFSLYENRFGHRAYGLGIEVGYGYAAGSLSTPFRGVLAIAGQLRWDLHDGFYQSWDEEHAYWLSSLSLGPRLVWTLPGPPCLRMAVEIPLLAAASRPPRNRWTKMDPLTRPSFHLIEMQKNMRLTGIPAFLGIRGGVTARMGARSSFSLSYDVDFTRFKDPEKVVTVSHRFTVSRRIGG